MLAVPPHISGDTLDLSPAIHTRSLIKIAAVGVVAGAISGLFGLGGGVIIVPGLVLLVGLNQRLAHGTSLAAIAPIAAAALLGFALDGAVDWDIALVLVAGSVIGAYVGTHMLERLPLRVLQFSFAVLLLIAATRLFVTTPDAVARDELTAGLAVVMFAVGLASGAVAGLLGVGGGIVMVPAMIILLGMPDVIAKGTSLAVILPTAVVGTVRNIANRNADLKVAGVVSAAGRLAAFAASRVALELEPGLSQALFGTLLVVLAAQLIWRAVRSSDGS